MTVEEWLGEDNELGIDIWKRKYQYEDETFDHWLDRVSGGNEDIRQLIVEKKFLFGGRVLANRGLNHEGRKVTYSNCYCLQRPSDSLESIFETSKKLARTYSYGGGCGVDISNLAPKGAKIRNAAKETSGAISFMDLFSLTTELIGQNGRRGALMISMSVDHPDIIDFITVKTDIEKVTKANISIRMTDEFMEAAEENRQYRLHYTREATGEVIEKIVNAKDVVRLVAETNWNYGEPGMLFWDRIESDNLLANNPEFELAGTNPCITGNTKIFTGDGRYIVDVETLFNEYSTDPSNFKVPVLTWDSKICRNKMEYINWVQYSGKKKVYAVMLDDGTYVKATDNHKFMLSDGSPIYVKDLKPGDSLMPMRAWVAAPVEGGKTYHDLYVNMNDNSYKNYYHLQSELLFNKRLEDFGRHKGQLNVHHLDENHENNLLSNLSIMTSDEHSSHHRSGENNPMVRWWNSAPEDVKDRYRKKMSERTSGCLNGNYGRVASEEKRRKLSEAASRFMKIPEVQAKHSKGNARHRSMMIKKVIDILVDNGLNINEINYDSHRLLVSKVCPSWKKIQNTAELLGFSDIQNYFDWLMHEFNHRVVSIEYIGEEDVYDINVNNNHNFAVVTSGYEDFDGSLSSLHSLSGIIICNCGEMPLPPGGACNLGSINLSEFVDNPFTEYASFNLDKFTKCARKCVRGLNEVLDEGLPLHPLQEQKDSVRDWRQIGLGIMGLADMLIKLGIKYGSEECLKLCDTIGFEMANAAIDESSRLAGEFVTYPKYTQAIVDTEYFKNNTKSSTLTNVLYNGLRNSQLLTIAPTGTLSTMLGISGGIEPVFSYSYTRKTESLFGEDKYYTVYAKIVQDYLKVHPEVNPEHLPDYFVDAMHLDYKQRVDTQATWQKHIDASISSTVNVPENFTVEDVENMYMYAWEKGCKGITLFRTNCKRAGILTPKAEAKEETSNELKRGEIQQVNDDVIGRKRKLMTGCGTLHCEAFFDPKTGKLLETYLSKGSTGGCNNFMVGLSRMISLSARAGVDIDKIIDQLNSTGVCPSYAVRRATQKDTSKGSCCPMAVGNALRDMYNEVQESLNHTCDCQGNKCHHKDETSVEVTDIHTVADFINDEYHCPECGEELMFEGGCNICKNCGWSRCG